MIKNSFLVLVLLNSYMLAAGDLKNQHLERLAALKNQYKGQKCPDCGCFEIRDVKLREVTDPSTQQLRTACVFIHDYSKPVNQPKT